MWPMVCRGPLALHLPFECPPSRAAADRVPVRTEPGRMLPRGTPAPYSMLPADSRFFSPSFEGVEKGLPASFKVPLSGFGYPLRGFRSPALESFFHLSTLLGFSLQSFSPRRHRAVVSARPFRSYPFSRNLHGLDPGFQRFHPPPKPPSSRPRRISSGRKRCSPGIPGSFRIPPVARETLTF